MKDQSGEYVWAQSQDITTEEQFTQVYSSLTNLMHSVSNECFERPNQGHPIGSRGEREITNAVIQNLRFQVQRLGAVIHSMKATTREDYLGPSFLEFRSQLLHEFANCPSGGQLGEGLGELFVAHLCKERKRTNREMFQEQRKEAKKRAEMRDKQGKDQTYEGCSDPL
jgi:hypothetical protein